MVLHRTLFLAVTLAWTCGLAAMRLKSGRFIIAGSSGFFLLLNTG